MKVYARKLIPWAVLLWLLSGTYLVRTDERAVVRRFGRVVDGAVQPGLHISLPWLIDRVDKLKVREQKRLSIGFDLTDEVLGRMSSSSQREFLTGDQNLINIALVLQYQIEEPVDYLFATRNPTDLLRTAAESVLADAVADRGVDALLTTGKFEVQTELIRGIQEHANRYSLGIRLSSVNLSAVTPPGPVSEAFKQVASARADRDRFQQEAEAYANDLLPRARGEAEKTRAEALAYREASVRHARGDAGRFLKAYEGYRTAKAVTRQRLYLETMEEILPRLNTVVVDSQGGRAPVDLNLVPRRSAPPNGNDNQ